MLGASYTLFDQGGSGASLEPVPTLFNALTGKKVPLSQEN